MTTKDLARLMRSAGRVLAVAAAVAVVGAAVRVAAVDDRHESKNEKKHDEGEHKKKPWPKVRVCHVDGRGRSHMISVSGDAESAHREHGDARPGERVPRDRRFRFNDECKEVPPPGPAPAPAPAPVPTPPPDPQMACPCWNTYMQSQLLAVLSPTSAPAQSYCEVNPTTVSLSQDIGISTLVYASSSGACILRLGGQDVGNNFNLTAEEAPQCMAEATALVPSIKWCPPTP